MKKIFTSKERLVGKTYGIGIKLNLTVSTIFSDKCIWKHSTASSTGPQDDFSLLLFIQTHFLGDLVYKKYSVKKNMYGNLWDTFLFCVWMHSR